MSDWNKPKSKPKPAPKKPTALRGIVAGAGVVLALGAVYFFMFGNEPEVEVKKTTKTHRIKEVTPAPARTNRVAATVAATNVVEKKVDTWLGSKVVRRHAETNGYFITETVYTEDGKKHLIFNDTTPSVFEHATDQILAMVTGLDERHGAPPPLPALGKDFENEFADSLKTPIIIKDDDPPEIREMKQRVKDARQALLDRMGEGLSAQFVIAEHKKMVENAAELRMEAVRGLKEYIAKGDMEGAETYCAKINEALDNMGIMRIEIPRSREEIRAERMQRSLEKEQNGGSK